MFEKLVAAGMSLLPNVTGEEPLSFGYGGTAKSSTNLKFEDYGETFTAGDVMTAYLVSILCDPKNGSSFHVW